MHGRRVEHVTSRSLTEKASQGRVLAKSDPPVELHKHLSQVRLAAQALLTPARLTALDRAGVGRHHAEDLLLCAAWLHDFGKATAEWQDALCNRRPLPQHALTSYLATLWAMGASSPSDLLPERLAVALAILAHHGQLSVHSFTRDRYRNQAIHFLSEMWDALAAELPFKNARQRLPDAVQADRICTKVEEAKRLCPQLARDGRFRGLYCLLLTLLVSADHAASGGGMPSPKVVGAPRIPAAPTGFQQDVQRTPGEVLCAIAGCGSGKTAAALLRAAEQADSSQVDRVVICLPTRFTSNSLLRDISSPERYGYAPGEVGLVHAEALQVLRRLQEEDEGDFPGTPEEEFSRAMRYEHPVTVSTVDHLLMSLYHGHRFADRAFGNLMSALVVLDEVHAYDTTTLSAIREGLAVLERHGIPTLVMSATLPSSRRRFLGLSDERTIVERDNAFHPFIVEQADEPLTVGHGMETIATDAARRLLRDAAGLKLAVYVNQVERAKALARAAREELPDKRVFCYHSELAPRDRMKLESRIVRFFRSRRDLPVVLVATQAAELSLDISAERMITEQAPADVLIQRAGRLNRRGTSPVLLNPTRRLPAGFLYRLVVAPLEGRTEDGRIAPSALPYSDPALLERSWHSAPWNSVFSFESGLQWCEAALTEDLALRSIGLEGASVDDAVFGRKPEENYGGEGDDGIVTLRDRDEEYWLVVPEASFTQLQRKVEHAASVAGIPPSDIAENRCLNCCDFALTLDQVPPFQVPIRRRKFFAVKQMGFVEERNLPVLLYKGHRTRRRCIDYPLHVVKSNIPYDPTMGGFDFRVIEGEMPPTESESGLL